MMPDTPAAPTTPDLVDLFIQAIRYGIDVETDYYGNGQNDEEFIYEPARAYAERASEARSTPLTQAQPAAARAEPLDVERLKTAWRKHRVVANLRGYHLDCDEECATDILARLSRNEEPTDA